jgi:hypothetical protein
MLEPGESTETKLAYNNDHRLDKITYPSGAIENYKLEPATGRPETITAEGVTGTTVPKLTYAYKQGEDDTSLIKHHTIRRQRTDTLLWRHRTGRPHSDRHHDPAEQPPRRHPRSQLIRHELLRAHPDRTADRRAHPLRALQPPI